MDTDEVKLETIKQRILNEGEKLLNTRAENGRYFVKLMNGPEIAFDESYRATVDAALNRAMSGIRDSGGGKFDNVNGQRPAE